MNADLIAKIQKLRALAESTNVNEAANAAAAAERLIAEHQLTEADLNASESVPESAEAFAEPLFAHEGNKRIYWKEWLAQGLARLYGVVLNCRWVSAKEKCDYFPYERYASRVGFTCVGTKSDVELLRYQYAYLMAEIERLTQRFLRENRFAKGEAKTAANNFRIGASEGVVAAMSAARKEQTKIHAATAGNDRAAMVLVGRLDAAKALHRKFYPSKYDEKGELRRGRTVSARTDYAAREAGRRAGASIHQGAKLGAGGQRLLGGKS